MKLYKLAESCNYGDMKTEMIRDRLVVGIVLSQHLQLDADLTLEIEEQVLRWTNGDSLTLRLLVVQPARSILQE